MQDNIRDSLNIQEDEISESNIVGKFCWAGLIMPQFWAIGNKIWIGLLAFIPILFPFVAVYLGVNGTNLIKKNYPYKDIETINHSNRKWSIAAFIYTVVIVLLIIMARML